MCSENLDQGDFKGGYFPVHENASEVQLDLEANVHIGTVDGGTPPQGESSIRNLVESGPLRVR